MRNVREEARDIPVFGEYDVVVCGGGPAGVSAASSAARNGAKTLIVERMGSLGGLASGGPVVVMTGSSASGNCGRIVSELGEHSAQREDGGVIFDPENLKGVLDRFVLDSGAQILLNTLVVGADCVDDRVQWLFIENKSGRQAIGARYVVDATGDADSVTWCGVDYLQPGTGVIRDVSPVFRMGNVEVDAYHSFLQSDANNLPGSVVLGDGVKLFYSGWYETLNPGELWIDALFIEGIDPTNAEDVTKAEILAREYVGAAVDKIKELPGFEHAFLSDTSRMLGIRESRHIVGRYTVSGDDVDIEHDDAVAIAKGDGSWFGRPVAIPYRCLIPEFMDNLVFAGRCISATQDVYDAIRSIPSCMSTGQAAGTAAALCAADGNKPISEISVKTLQKRLRDEGIGV